MLGSLVGMVDGVGSAVSDSHVMARVVFVMPVFSLMGPIVMVSWVVMGLPAMMVAVVWLMVRVVVLLIIVIIVVGAVAVVSMAISMVISMIIPSMMVSIVMSMLVVTVGVSSWFMVVGLVMGWGVVYVGMVYVSVMHI